MYNTKKIIKNAFRISKIRGEGAIRIRVPGGHLEARHLEVIKTLAEKFGNGTVHLTTRQGYEIPGVKLADLEKVKKYMARMIDDIEKESNVILENPEEGYPQAGTRNVSACIGNRVCQFANSDTTLLAQKIENVIYPNNLHLKVALAACPNDCIKAHVNDIGIIANITPEYDEEKCIACEACIDNCQARVTNAMRMENYKVIRDEEYCIKCGECILKCPTGALSRGKQLYRIIVGGRTGKKNPRLTNTFIDDASEEVVLAVCKNVYHFIDKYIYRHLPKELIGYIIDREGYEVFTREVLKGVELNPEAEVLKPDNPGYFYAVRP
ncbi:MAG: sulfite reductase subunit C [Candidatus Omnitrophota bacterium]